PPLPRIAVSSLYGSIYPSVQNLLLAARAAGLGAALITLPLWSTWLARRALGLPWTITPCAVIPLGWPRGRYGPTQRRPVGEGGGSARSCTSIGSAISRSGTVASPPPDCSGRSAAPHRRDHLLGERLQLLNDDRCEQHEDEVRDAGTHEAIDRVQALLLVAD